MAEVRIVLDGLLEERGMTRYQLAKQSGVQYQTVDKYYKNKVTRYDRDIIARLCAALGCTPGDMIQLK